MKAIFYVRFLKSKINPKHHLACRKLYFLTFECSQSWYSLEMESNYEISKIWLSGFELTFSDFCKSELEVFNPIHDSGCSQMRGCPKRPLLLKIYYIYPTMIKLGTVIPYIKKTQKTYKLRDTPIQLWWHQHFFRENQKLLLYQEIQI